MLLRWHPLQEVEEVSRQFDRLFRELAPQERETTKGGWIPASELRDDGDHLTLRLSLPDIEPKDLDIQVTKDSLSIAGERHIQRKDESDKGYYWSEISYGKFRRVFALPVAIENDRVKAEYNNGILTLTLPKANEVKAFKVNVSNELPASESNQ
ncbi:Hsp20/alpha crystallin family protein [Pseudanabaena sp. UWO310]|uniref:Hsp20/alpha crystallin family protein n=1 Tax=Pseudanabaena sp. UWO310 TaxID=2480795 RepID=UPI001161299F|nr:Hsp20/alpha crystallin family protein [Pseudanabaena sp. UWO310]TYQ23928.1 Hsp20/alpha crystallin family protein [Pseudanabaena sp. UWO310]